VLGHPGRVPPKEKQGPRRAFAALAVNQAEPKKPSESAFLGGTLATGQMTVSTLCAIVTPLRLRIHVVSTLFSRLIWTRIADPP